MNSDELSAKALTQISVTEFAFEAPPLGEKLKRNAGKVMKEIPLQRLQAGGQQLVQQRGSRYQWGEGIILNRNSRVGGGFWTNMPPSQLEDLRQVTADLSPERSARSGIGRDQPLRHGGGSRRTAATA